MRIFKTILAVLFALVILWPANLKAQGPLTGPTSGKLGVTPAGYDDMGAILSSMGYAADEISWEDLKSIDKLKQYSAIYINCSGDADSNAEEIAPAIKQYVEEGGILYASDFAESIVSKAFPGKISFYDGGAMGSRAGAVGKVNAKVVDAGMAAVLGKSEIEITFDLPAWAVMESTTGRTYMSGSAPILDLSGLMNNIGDLNAANIEELTQQAETMSSASNKSVDVPLVVSFEAGKGEVLYTSFHNEAQVTADVTKVLNWFANRAQAAGLAAQSRGLAASGEEAVLEVVDSLQKNQTKTYTFNATGQADFQAVLNFGGSSLGIKIKDPKGQTVADETVSQPPYQKAIAGATKGKYTFSVTAKDIPTNNYPFVLTVLGPKNAGAALQSNEAVKTTGTSAFTNLTSWLTSRVLWLALAGLIFVLLVVTIVIIKVRKPHPSTSTKE